MKIEIYLQNVKRESMGMKKRKRESMITHLSSTAVD